MDFYEAGCQAAFEKLGFFNAAYPAASSQASRLLQRQQQNLSQTLGLRTGGWGQQSLQQPSFSAGTGIFSRPGATHPLTSAFKHKPMPPELQQHMQQSQRWGMSTVPAQYNPMFRGSGFFKQSGTRVPTSYEQTYQRQAGSLRGAFPITEEVGAHWDEHDKRMAEQTTPHAAEDVQFAT